MEGTFSITTQCSWSSPRISMNIPGKSLRLHKGRGLSNPHRPLQTSAFLIRFALTDFCSWNGSSLLQYKRLDGVTYEPVYNGCVSSADPRTAYCQMALTPTSVNAIQMESFRPHLAMPWAPGRPFEVYTHDQARFDAKGRTMSAKAGAWRVDVSYITWKGILSWVRQKQQKPQCRNLFNVLSKDRGKHWKDWQAGKSEWKRTVKTKLAPSTTADGILSAGWPKRRTLCGLVAIIIQEMLWHLSLSWKMWYYVDWLRKSRIAFNFEQSSNKSYASFSKLFSLKNEKCFTADWIDDVLFRSKKPVPDAGPLGQT